jgi:hypothetical protein
VIAAVGVRADGTVQVQLDVAALPVVGLTTRDSAASSSMLFPMLDGNLSDNQSLPVLVVFAGDHCGRQSSIAIKVRALKGRALEYDWAGNDMRWDLSKRENQQKILDMLRNKQARGVHVSFPCQSTTVLGDHMRSLNQPRGKDGITDTQREFCESQNVLLDFGIECLWAAFRSNISVTGEFPCFRGAKGVPPKRA